METRLFIHNERDAIAYIAPIIINACREFAGNITSSLCGISQMVRIDFQTTSFGYTINKIDPKILITVMVVDSHPRPFISIGVPFIKDDLFFKITFVNIYEKLENCPEECKFKLDYCRDLWGYNIIDKKDIALPLSPYTKKFVELNELIERLVVMKNNNTSTTFIKYDEVNSDESEVIQNENC